MTTDTGVRLLGPVETRALADGLGVRPRKTRGQNFVVDPNTVRRIVATAKLTEADAVIEVGPGLGALTLGLAAACRSVVAVEVDPRLAAALPATLAEHAPGHADRVQVLAADALQIRQVPGPPPTRLVANLPYNVAVPVLLHLLAVLPSLRSGLVMVQAEVADRLTAGPGSRRYGVPSVKAAWYADVRPAGRVSRRVFWPVPRVDSALVALNRHPPPPCAVDRTDVFAVVDTAFAGRRKTLRAALTARAGSAAAVERALERAGVSPQARGEALDVAAFARIAEALTRGA